MFTKLFSHIKKKKNIVDEFEDKGFEIDLNNLWKYPPQELHSIINNYEKFIEKIKKKGSEIHEEINTVKEKITQLENEKNQLTTEKVQFKNQVDHFCNLLTLETKEKEKLKYDLESLKIEKANLEISKNENLNSKNNENNEEFENLAFKFKEMNENYSINFKTIFDEIKISAQIQGIKNILEDFQNKIPENSNSINLNEDFIKKIEEIIKIEDFFFQEILNKISNGNEIIEKFIQEIKLINENCDKVQKDTERNENLTHKLENLTQNYEKSEKIRVDLESDIMKMSSKMNQLKTDNQNFSNLTTELKNKLKIEEKKVDDLTLQNKGLTEEIALIKEKFSSIVNEKTKYEEISSCDLREVKNELETYKLNYSKLDEYSKTQEEKNIIKLRDFENKLIQERLKVDQKMREFSKLEEQYSQAKSDLLSQIELNNKNNEKISLMEAKIINDKKILKEEKKKNKNLNKQISDLQTKNWNENDERENKTKSLEKQILVLQEQINEEKNKCKNDINKDLEIKNQEILISELKNSNFELITKEKEYFQKISDLEKENDQIKNEIIIMQKKREAALAEIKRLNEKYNILKIANTPKLKENHSEIMSAAVISKKNSSSPSQYSITNSNNPMKKETKLLIMIKKEIETLYREFIQIIPFDKNNEVSNAFIKIEKKMNDTIRRTQDFIDNLEEN